MRDFKDKVAVVTGAASGIGLGMAERFAEAGMRVVLADVETEALKNAEQELRGAGADVLAVRTDVSKLEDVQHLADRAIERFGKVHVVCNNAGVSAGGTTTWESTIADWQWVMGVNLWGVIHGVHVFLPLLLSHGEEGHVVNTSSVLGLSSGPGGAVYGVTKHAVTRLTEGLYYDLRAMDAPVGASVLCPGMIATNIIESDRNRPADLRNAVVTDPLAQERRAMTSQLFKSEGMPPPEVGSIVLDAIRDERFYILTHPDIKERVRTRMEDILEDRNPTPPEPGRLAEMRAGGAAGAAGAGTPASGG